MCPPAGDGTARASFAGAGRVTILGVPVDRLSMDEAVWAAERLLKSFATDRRPRLVLTPNPEIIFAAQQDAELKEILSRADLAVADGAGVVWAARLLGRPVPERVAGVDMLLRLLDLSARRGYRVFFLGTRPDVLARAVEFARRSYPGLVIVGSHHGYFRSEEEAAVIEAVRLAQPDFLFSGMGAPRDQKWLWRHRDALGVPVSMGVGGSFDVLAGVVTRAPRWMQRAYLEWLFRLFQQPSRWRRMLALPRFALMVWRQARSAARRDASAGGDGDL